MDFAKQRNRGKWLAVLVALAIIAFVAAIGKVGYGLLIGSKGQSPNLTVNGTSPAPAIVVNGKVSAPPVQVLATRKEMPTDVYAWLQHLQRCDLAKRDLAQKADGELASMIPELKGAGGLTSPGDVDRMTDPDSDISSPPGANLINQEIDQITTDWKQLKVRFDKMPPPAECQPIADAYDAGLGDFLATVDQIDSLLNGINVKDPDLRQRINTTKNSLNGIKRNNTQGIDNMFAQTDTLVQQICDKYDVKKWFSIDVSGGSMSALSSFGF